VSISPIKTTDLHIAICGGGLAGYMTAAALSRHLPETCKVTFIVTEEAPAADIFYGSVTAPSAYDFNLSLGVSEPELVLESDTAFSFGTHYQGWGGEGREWVQGFQQPLPVLGGVQFHQYLTRAGLETLEPYLVSAAAAKHGVFAHPPEQAAHPLSRAEYGYQLDVRSYRELFASAMDKSRLVVIQAEITDIDTGPEGLEVLHLSDGRTLSADMFVDCTGPEAVLLSRLDVSRTAKKPLGAVMTRIPEDTLGPAVRTVTGQTFGWQSITPLQGASAKLTVFAESDKASALAVHGDAPEVSAKAEFGRRSQAWSGNCVAVGQAAATIEPLTPAPIICLQRDIERLLSLIPLSRDMAMERREFNRQFDNDYQHAELLRQAFFATTPVAGSVYWQEVSPQPADLKLDRKLTQFLSRGILVSYDLEPFTPEDWVIFHYGMGHRPLHGDRLADQTPQAQVKSYFSDLRRHIGATVAALPSHNAYMSGLKRFLLQKSS
jgi:tryptophan halogenase